MAGRFSARLKVTAGVGTPKKFPPASHAMAPWLRVLLAAPWLAGAVGPLGLVSVMAAKSAGVDAWWLGTLVNVVGQGMDRAYHFTTTKDPDGNCPVGGEVEGGSTTVPPRTSPPPTGTLGGYSGSSADLVATRVQEIVDLQRQLESERELIRQLRRDTSNATGPPTGGEPVAHGASASQNQREEAANGNGGAKGGGPPRSP